MNINQVTKNHPYNYKRPKLPFNKIRKLVILENETSEEAEDLWIKISKNLGRSFFKLGKNGPSLDKFDEILNLLPNDLDVLLLKVSKNPINPKIDSKILFR